MSMHLEGPWLSTTGKRKRKQKFRNASEARRARELDESWNDLMKKYETKTNSPKKPKSLSDSYKLAVPEDRRTLANAKSVDSGVGFAAKKESQKYTGTLIKGIATMHKSNAVPVLNQEDAEAIAKMRR